MGVSSGSAAAGYQHCSLPCRSFYLVVSISLSTSIQVFGSQRSSEVFTHSHSYLMASSLVPGTPVGQLFQGANPYGPRQCRPILGDQGKLPACRLCSLLGLGNKGLGGLECSKLGHLYKSETRLGGFSLQPAPSVLLVHLTKTTPPLDCEKPHGLNCLPAHPEFSTTAPSSSPN